MPAPRRRRRSPARWLAPVALLVAGVAVYIGRARATRPAAGDARRRRTSTARPRARRPSARARAKKAKSRTYTVKAGDTLSGIASKTGVSLTRIEELNPKLDSQALQTGETIKLGP